jgi:hypothetical protein
MTVMQLKCPTDDSEQDNAWRAPEKADPADMPDFEDIGADEEEEEDGAEEAEAAAAEDGAAPINEADEAD